MPVTRCVHSLLKKSGEEKDNVVNVWHFWHPFALTLEVAQKIGFAVSAFYSSMNTQLSIAIKRTTPGQRLAISPLTIGGAGTDDDVLGASVYTFEDSLTSGTPPAGEPMPNEVALCLSFSSDLEGIPEESGTMRPAARRRGRLYLGPWQATLLEKHITNDEPQADYDKINQFLVSYQAMITTLQNVTTPALVGQRVSHIIYSPTSGLEWPVTRVWMNAEFDIIRSRGVRAPGQLGDVVTQSRELT